MRIPAFILTAVILLLAAVLVGPSLMDWNKYKAEITRQVKAASGYDVQINGDLSLAVLPSPRVTFKDTIIRAPNPVREQTLVAVEEATVSVALLPLLQKRVVVESIRLVKPDIRLEVNQEGRQSWMVTKAAETVDAVSEIAEASVETAQESDALKSISLDSVVVEEGRLQFIDYQKNSTQLVEMLNLDLNAGSVYGPYKAKGDLVYGGNKIAYDIKSSAIETGKDDLEINAKVSLPEKNAAISFDGVAGRRAPYNAQGEIRLTLDKLQDVASVPDALAGKTRLQGMLTANDSQASIRDADFEIGALKGKGAVDIGGIKEKNPLNVAGRFDLESGLNIDDLTKKSPAKAGMKDKATPGGGAAKTGGASPVPQSLTLPFALSLDVIFSAPELSMNGQTLKDVEITLLKKHTVFSVDLRAKEIPGRGTLDAGGTLKYASASVNAGGGVTYADPSLNFSLTGSAQQLPTLLRAVLPEQKSNPALEAFKTAAFDIKGGLSGETITLKDSQLTLDSTVLVLGGFYTPAAGGGKPDVGIDLTADYLNIDDLKARLDGQKEQAVQPAATGQKTDVKAALEPVRNFSLPVNLTFDVSVQKARINSMDASGIRLKGKSTGDMLSLDTASAQSILGASVSAKGRVESLKNLSGIDLDLYGKAADVKSVMSALKMDTSKLPAQLSSAEAAIDAKGTAEALNFNANVKALSGSLDATGTATGLLDKPVFGNLTLRVKHPNFVQAMQIVNPGFSGGAGLAKPLDLYARLVNEGKVYTLNDFKASLGATTASGDLRYDASGAKPAINGTLVLGDVPLDSLLAAKKGGGSSTGSGASPGVTGGSAGDERWSSNAFDMGWMHTANMNLKVSAKSITYGGWNFQNPKTDVSLNNGSLKVQDLTAGLFGGSAKLDAAASSSADQKQPVSLSVTSSMDKVNIEQLAAALSSSNRIKASGVGSLSFDVAGSGISPNAMVNSLKGKAGLDAANVVFHGFDLAQLAGALLDSGKPLDRLQGIVGGATTSGQTKFDTIDGDYTISEGVVSISSMNMTGPAAVITSSGNVSLPRWYIDTVHMIKLTDAKELEPFRVEIKGSLSNPGNTFGRGLFDEILRRRVQDKVEEKLQEKLPDLLGDDTTKKLQQFGILPQKQAPASAPTPAPDAAPVQPDIAPAPAPAQPQQQKPEDVLKDVLGGFLSQ